MQLAGDELCDAARDAARVGAARRMPSLLAVPVVTEGADFTAAVEPHGRVEGAGSGAERARIGACGRQAQGAWLRGIDMHMRGRWGHAEWARRSQRG